MLEPYVLKGTRTVLRRERESNLSNLSDQFNNNRQQQHRIHKHIPIQYPNPKKPNNNKHEQFNRSNK